MAVKTVAVTALVSGEAATVVESAGTTAINGSTDTINITGGAGAARLLLLLNNTTAASKVITIKAGTTNPPAQRKGLGDLALTVLEKTTQVVAIESARFANPDGTISLSFGAGTTGFVSALRLPKAL